MSLRHQAGINLPGYNALKVANAPTIGAATQASCTSVSVTFTAPSCIGGGAITSYTAFACCGIKTANGASSPLTVTGLTTGQTYTFKVFATNAYGPSYPSAASNSVTPLPTGQQAYTTAGTYTFVVPANVTSVSVLAVGGGGGGGSRFTGGCCCIPGGGGGGGGLGYRNNISVTPGSSISISVGAGGAGATFDNFSGASGGNSSFNGTVVRATGGGGGPSGFGAGGAGSYSGTSVLGGNGGVGGAGSYSGSGGGGGAAGYSGNGGKGQDSTTFGAGNGGGGAGGSFANGGGGVGILGQGSSGTTNGQGGSGGADQSSGVGGSYGGGGGAGPVYSPTKNGGVGAVRIIWPGTTRSFPSTNTGNL